MPGSPLWEEIREFSATRFAVITFLTCVVSVLSWCVSWEAPSDADVTTYFSKMTFDVIWYAESVPMVIFYLVVLAT